MFLNAYDKKSSIFITDRDTFDKLVKGVVM